MDHHEIEEVLACLPQDRTLFRYFKDRYAFELLDRAFAHASDLARIRRSRYGRLLEKPAVKSLLAQMGSERNVRDWVGGYWPDHDVQSYVLTLGRWGTPKNRGYSQTSRRGYNLVLQLNLSGGEMARFRELVSHPHRYNARAHPVCPRDRAGKRETLAWARIDVSFDTNEALIEEIQSDFVRYVEWRKSQHKDHEAVQAFVRPHKDLWEEAMLTAALQFIWDELGVGCVYYHEHRTGSALKGIRHWHPPRSIYEALPRKFCMTRVDDVPAFLARDKFTKRVLKQVRRPRFFRSNVGRVVV